MGKRSSSHIGQIQRESIKRIYSKHHRTFDGFSEIHIIDTTTKYDYNTKSFTTIQESNYIIGGQSIVTKLVAIHNWC